jgi:uncharacterized protein (TIGR02001 family)
MTVTAAIAATGAAAAYAAEPLVKSEDFPGKFSATVGFTNEYYFRGLSQTDDAPALQGSLDYALDLVKDAGWSKDISFYLGAWGSNVDFNESTGPGASPGIDGATIEIDLYTGAKGTLGAVPIGWDVGVIWYTYPGADDQFGYDYWEYKIALSYDFGFLSTTASYNYSPNFFAESGDGHYPKFAIAVPVMGKVDLGAYIARQWVERNDRFATRDYTEWNISAKVNVVGFDLSVAYSDVNVPGNVDGKKEAVLFAVSRTF